MRTATVVAIVVVVVLLGGVAVYSFGLSGGEQLRLQERWVSDTARDLNANHHAPAAGRVNGTGMVYAPVSGRSDTPNCALYGLSAANGTSKWSYQIPTQNCAIHSVANPTLADYDSDGVREVLAATTEQAIIAFNPLTGEEELRVNLTDYGYTRPVVTDLRGDASKEIVVVDVKGTVLVVRPNGTNVWSARLESYTWGQPGVADFDGDGKKEVVIGISDGNLTMFEGDGSVSWRRQDAFGESITWMATGQADDDPGTEVVVATTGGTVALIDGNAGEIQWQKDFGNFAAVHAFGDGDGDGEPEIYAVARDGKLRSLDAKTGTVEWTTTLTSANVQMMPPPALGNVDDDEAKELVAVTNDGIVSVIDPRDGDVLDTYKREVSIFSHPQLADTDGDGVQEIYVMYGDGRVVALEAAGNREAKQTTETTKSSPSVNHTGDEFS